MCCAFWNWLSSLWSYYGNCLICLQTCQISPIHNSNQYSYNLFTKYTHIIWLCRVKIRVKLQASFPSNSLPHSNHPPSVPVYSGISEQVRGYSQNENQTTGRPCTAYICLIMDFIPTTRGGTALARGHSTVALWAVSVIDSNDIT